jgi:hypothetical protein
MESAVVVGQEGHQVELHGAETFPTEEEGERPVEGEEEEECEAPWLRWAVCIPLPHHPQQQLLLLSHLRGRISFPSGANGGRISLIPLVQSYNRISLHPSCPSIYPHHLSLAPRDRSVAIPLTLQQALDLCGNRGACGNPEHTRGGALSRWLRAYGTDGWDFGCTMDGEHHSGEWRWCGDWERVCGASGIRDDGDCVLATSRRVGRGGGGLYWGQEQNHAPPHRRLFWCCSCFRVSRIASYFPLEGLLWLTYPRNGPAVADWLLVEGNF